MLLYDGNAPGPNPVTVRHFILERGGLTLDVQQIDLAHLANREADDVESVIDAEPQSAGPASRCNLAPLACGVGSVRFRNAHAFQGGGAGHAGVFRAT